MKNDPHITQIEAGIRTADPIDVQRAKERVVRGAMRWWESHRPTEWTERDHIAMPYVNVPRNHADLAHACAALSKKGKPRVR